MRWGPLLLIAGLFAAAVAAAWLLRGHLAFSGSGAGLVYLLMAAVLVGGGLFAHGRLAPGALRNAVLWLGIFVVTAAIVAYCAPGFR